jgi:hypothetical protein
LANQASSLGTIACPAAKDVVSLGAELEAKGRKVRLLGPVEGAATGWDEAAPEALATVLALVRGQQLARRLAISLGRDPDIPEGLFEDHLVLTALATPEPITRIHGSSRRNEEAGVRPRGLERTPVPSSLHPPGCSRWQ